jgi:DNA-binding transcriptional MerR regulator
MARASVLSIGTVARMLGVSTVTLRTWEERYGLVVPQRSAGGQRLYSPQQVDQLRFVVEQVRAGTRAGEAHRLLGTGRSARGVPVFDLAPAATAPSEARRHIEEVLRDADGQLLFDAKLIVSELVANAVRHGNPRGPIRLTLEPTEAGVRAVVEHEGTPFEWRQKSSVERGRGLQLVASLSPRWGITFDGARTLVWFELGDAVD